MSNEKDNGGPAFAPMGAPDPNDPMKATYGMTLRDWFAGQALAGFAANTDLTDRGFPEMADYAYKQADAMLAERSK